ncbi:Phosphatidylinositolglycan class N-domain-containing protein [Lipomyces chichibuensis]|uniref:Phosphatidylinositolglycan class N-domain-containing protein n=1 Tax=Lipomyces chichibuensis TaxID=1546026 RepID=UPI003342F5EB
MNRLGKQSVLVIGILFHLVYLWSIFDIYFITPLVHGMQHFISTEEAPAKRLFLIVGDGLRADKCFGARFNATSDSYEYAAPFIRSKILEEGTFGVSHTRMPTESRPGHVAIIAGFYEDVSAVTKGWKENPVDFDSVFNQSRHTWSFGSPDILPMFAMGASDSDRVEVYMYGHEFEDFTKDSRDLDTFVFDKVEALFKNATTDPRVDAALRQDKIVFFLHLLGIDTAGHVSRPKSVEYFRNIQHIDTGVQKLQKTINEFYQDDKTAWVFTADHGMSDMGSHGDGHPDNTRTPLVAWGAGVAKPNTRNPTGHDEFSIPWDLNTVKRVDVEQADIASLMSYLVGLNYPVNSVGRLPLDFIDAPLEWKSKAIVANARAILEQYRVKELQTIDIELNFKPFPLLENGSSSLNSQISKLREFDANGEYENGIELAHELMMLGLQGLRYLQTYDWLFLRSLVTCGFVGWILYALTSFLDFYILPAKIAPSYGPLLSSVAAVLLSVLFGMFYFKHSPLMHYLYAVFPVVFWETVAEYRMSLWEGLKILIWNAGGSKRNTVVKLSIQLMAFFVLMEAIVAGYFHREVFSVIYGMISVWPLIQNYGICKTNKTLVLSWFVSCWLMSTFTLLPVVKEESIWQILVAGGFMTAVGIVGMLWLARRSASGGQSISTFTMTVLGLQLGLIILSMAVTYSTVKSLQARRGLPFGNQIVGWLILGCSLTLPLLHLRSKYHDYRARLLLIFLTFAPTFILLTISYEGLFYVTFFFNLVFWVDLERKIYDDRRAKEHALKKFDKSATNGKHFIDSASRRLELADIRIALFFFFLTQIAFFGTGNIASISSFSLDSVYRLLPVFDPFAMGALLIFKILVPFAVISADLGLLTQRLGVKPSSLFAMVLSISDILTLNFFYLVLDEGSWLDIGMSISHYCIASLLCVFVIALEYLSEVLISGVTLERADDVPNDKKDQ